jgi:hypothetical protein
MQHRCDLQSRGVVVGRILDLDPYRSFFFDDPVNGLRLEYTTRFRSLKPEDRDPSRRIIPVSLATFEQAADPTNL